MFTSRRLVCAVASACTLAFPSLSSAALDSPAPVAVASGITVIPAQLATLDIPIAKVLAEIHKIQEQESQEQQRLAGGTTRDAPGLAAAANALAALREQLLGCQGLC